MKKRELNLEPTDFIIRGLCAMLSLLHTYGTRRGVPAKALALRLWPHSPGWAADRSCSLKHKGRGPVFAAANLLIRLERMQMAEKAESGYRLTGSGLLSAIEAQKKLEEAERRRKQRELLKEKRDVQ